MRIQNLPSWMLALLIAPMLCIAFIACSDDDKDEPDNKDIIVGTWVCLTDDTISLVFNTNNSGRYIEKYDDYDGGTEVASLTWSRRSKNSYLIRFEDDNEVWEATYDTKKSLLYVEDEYGYGDFFEKVK